MDLLLAARNRNKVNEFNHMLESLTLVIRTLDDFPKAPEVVEDAETFEANAVKKAVTLAKHTGLLTLADASGAPVSHRLNGKGQPPPPSCLREPDPRWRRFFPVCF